MKNTVKFFSMMLAAGAMMLASCEPEPGPEVPTTPKYTVTVSSNNEAYGTVSGAGTYDSASVINITALPNEGYKFVNWNDGNTENPRQVVVNSNLNFMANFSEADGIKVVFGDASWRPTTILGADYSGYGLLMIEGYKDYDRTDAPHISGYTGSTTGTFVHSQNDYYYFFYYENDHDYTIDEDGSLSGSAGATLPNWQPAQGFVIRVTALDLNAQTISATATGELFSLPEYINNNQVTKSIEITMNNAQWETAEKSVKASKSINARIVK